MDIEFLTTEEVAAELEVTPRRVRALITAGRLPAKTVGEGCRATHHVKRADLAAVRIRPVGRQRGSKVRNGKVINPSDVSADMKARKPAKSKNAKASLRSPKTK